jgi:hypothetical protein
MVTPRGSVARIRHGLERDRCSLGGSSGTSTDTRKLNVGTARFTSGDTLVDGVRTGIKPRNRSWLMENVDGATIIARNLPRGEGWLNGYRGTVVASVQPLGIPKEK